jgi:cytosine/adenosine deaminase-related metal-dependent hydrolase
MPAAAENPSLHTPRALRARWVLPIDRPPIEGGLVTLAGGQIVAVGENQSGQPPIDLGDVVLLPGLVNAHTHLEFSLLDRPLGQAGMAFPEWIGGVIEHRRAKAKSLMIETDGFQRFRRRAAEKGLAELRAAGTAAVGEIATPGWPRECFPASGLTVTVFLELLGLEADKQPTLLRMAGSFVSDVLDAGPKLRPGISPHAPYTVRPELVRSVAALSASERFPVAMHLAESRDELELLAAHRGPLVELLASIGSWHPEAIPQGSTPRDYLELLAEAHQALVIHGNFLTPDDWSFLAERRTTMSVVYCPRTHAYFRHGSYPLAEMLAAGVHVALGTDSLASNPDLSLLAELRQIAREHAAVAPEQILQMGTLAGAEALGLADRLGSIAPGKKARLAVVRTGAVRDPFAAILHSSEPIRPLTELFR